METPNTSLQGNNIWRPFYETDHLPDFLPTELRKPIGTAEPNGYKLADKVDFSVDGNERLNNDEDDEIPKEEAEAITPGQANQRSSTLSNKSHLQSSGRVRMVGGIPPVRKLVTAEGDSDDELIWEMRNKRYRDSDIRERLISEGRTRYDIKTISTRFKRIKEAKGQALESRLEADFEDYLEQDDEALRAAVADTEHQYLKDLAGVETKRWEFIAEVMNGKLPAPKFTSKLARERWDCLQNGTAVVPLEQDPDPEGRTARIKAEKLACQQSQEAERLRLKQIEEEAQLHRVRAADAAVEAKEEKDKARAVKKAAEEERKQKHQEKLAAAARARETENERRATAKVQQVMDRERLLRKKANEKAGKAWQKQQESRARRQKVQEEKLKKAQQSAQEKAAAVQEAIDEANSKELIRRHMRAAGACIAAPTFSS